MTKKSYVSLVIVAILGLAIGFYFRNLNINSIKADVIKNEARMIEYQGQIIKNGADFILIRNTDSIKIISQSPSLNLTYFLNKQVNVSGYVNKNIFFVISADIVE